MSENDNDVLQYAIDNGIIDLQYIQQQIDMNKRRKILEAHPYGLIYNEKKGRWYTRFKDDNGVIQRNRATKEELEDLVIEFYENGETFEKKDEIYTFSQAHDRWLEVPSSACKHKGFRECAHKIAHERGTLYILQMMSY